MGIPKADPEQQSKVLTERLGDISKQKQEAQAMFGETVSTFNSLQELMLHFQTLFDLVIIDTPPLHAFADAKYLINQADGLVMVVGLDKTEKPAVRLVLNDLHLSNLNLLGVVANGVKGYTSSYAGYYQNYYGKGKDSGQRYQMLKVGDKVEVKESKEM